MLTLAPIRPQTDIESLMNAGIDEAYIGFEDEVWKSRFGNVDCLNRMSNFGNIANFDSIEQIKEICSK